eukprot:6198952-Pleurochrysis_carterae.AAC.1
MEMKVHYNSMQRLDTGHATRTNAKGASSCAAHWHSQADGERRVRPEYGEEERDDVNSRGDVGERLARVADARLQRGGGADGRRRLHLQRIGGAASPRSPARLL